MYLAYGGPLEAASRTKTHSQAQGQKHRERHTATGPSLCFAMAVSLGPEMMHHHWCLALKHTPMAKNHPKLEAEEQKHSTRRLAAEDLRNRPINLGAK